MHTEDEYLRKIIQHLNRPDDEELRQEIRDWRSGSPDREALFQQVCRIWNLSPELKSLDTFPKEASAGRLGRKLAGLPPSDQPLHRRRNRWIRPVAAVFLLTLLGSGVWYWMNREVYLEKVTGNNRIDSIALADGSRIYLDENSHVRFPEAFGGRSREIELLEGRALFRVVQDSLRPFIVQLRRSSVRVLGTTFNIDNRGEQVALIVNTGSVQFTPPGGEQHAVLKAGEGLRYRDGQVQVFDALNENADSWLTGRLDFEDASLEEACKKLEKHYKIRIFLEDDIRSVQKLNATFDNSTLDEVIQILEIAYPISVTRRNDSLMIRNR